MTPTETVVLTDALEAAGVPFELLEHVPTQTAAGEALALGLTPHEVAKTIVVTAPEGNTRVLLPASERLDLHKLMRDITGRSNKLEGVINGELNITRANSSVSAAVTGFVRSPNVEYDANCRICAAAASAISARPWPTFANQSPAVG